MAIKLLFFTVLALQAQTNTVSLQVPPSARAGSSVAVAVSQSGGNPAATQYTLTVSPASAVSGIIASAGNSATAASKQVSCGAFVAGALTCLVLGVNVNTMADGVEITYAITVAPRATGNITFSISSALEANTTGGAVATTLPFPTGSMSVISPCDLNGDGVTNAADLALIS